MWLDLWKPFQIAHWSYEIIDFKDFKALSPAKDSEHMNETYTKGRPFHCVWELP